LLKTQAIYKGNGYSGTYIQQHHELFQQL